MSAKGSRQTTHCRTAAPVGMGPPAHARVLCRFTIGSMPERTCHAPASSPSGPTASSSSSSSSSSRMLCVQHPFILKAKGKTVIAQLVDECMAEIDEYREQEAKEAEEKDKSTYHCATP